MENMSKNLGPSPRLAWVTLGLLLLFVIHASPALAQNQNKGVEIADGLNDEVSGFFGILKTALGILVIVGLLVGGTVAMTKGDWTRGLVTVGFAILLIIAFFVISDHLGIGDGARGGPDK